MGISIVYSIDYEGGAHEIGKADTIQKAMSIASKDYQEYLAGIYANL
jgi:hypothetical protein